MSTQEPPKLTLLSMVPLLPLYCVIRLWNPEPPRSLDHWISRFS